MAFYNNFGDLAGDIGGAVKGVGHAVGSVLSNPLVDAGLSFIPGVGVPFAAAAGGLGGLLKPGGNIGSALSGTLKGGLSGSAAGLLSGGAQPLSGLLGGEGGAAAASAIPDTAMGITPGASSGGFLGGLEGIAGNAGDFLGGNGGKNALGVAQGVNAALQQKQSNDYAKQALQNVEGSYAERAPLRAQGIKGLMTAQAGNPYASGTPTAPMPVRGY